MDHDAMWTHVQKLMKFRDDFLVLSKLTADEFHKMAERVRAGTDPADAMDEVKGSQKPAKFKESVQELKSIENADDGNDIDPNAKPVAASVGLTGASESETGADGASQGEQAPASLPEGDVEPLGTDKSIGEVERAGEPLETTTVDAGTEALPAGQLPKE
jgi:hypothetical protein